MANQDFDIKSSSKRPFVDEEENQSSQLSPNKVLVLEDSIDVKKQAPVRGGVHESGDYFL